jgi:methionyl-tRNA formyltransferase
MTHNPRFVFFGTPDIAASALDELEHAGYVPRAVVTAPDKPQGRGLALAASPVKSWALARGIEVLQPEKIDSNVLQNVRMSEAELFIVVAYGSILPQALLDIPPRGTINIHPSLLPRFRGPSPVRSAILADERTTGVSVMLLDEKMDHGPLLAQKTVEVSEWPPRASAFEHTLVREGARLLATILPSYLSGDIVPQEQNHDVATYCTKIEKEDGLLDMSADPHTNLLKIRAYEGWPGTYTYFLRGAKKIRVAILDAHIDDKALVIDKVKPEGKNEMPYTDFLRSGARPQ